MKSHPTWVRGLKYYVLAVALDPPESHPTWVRGLKYLHQGRPKQGGRRTPRGCVD